MGDSLAFLDDLSLPRVRRLIQLLKPEQERRQAKIAHSQRGGLIHFVRYFWPILEPETELVDGWPLEAICEHLEAVTYGEITRLLMTVPPGFMKSLLCDVFWPAWEWGPMGFAHYRYVAFSYSAGLTERDNDKFRTLVASPQYQALYGPGKVKAVKFAPHADDPRYPIELRNKTITKVMNTHTGWKLASSVGGVGTGERGDRIICDDLHNVKEAESEIVREETTRWFRESVSTRFNNMDTGALIVIMQRVHEDDVAGVILSLGLDYTHLMIPWEYDSSRQVDEQGNAISTTIGWTDPRYDPDDPHGHDGEPAWPERFSEHAMARLRTALGPYAWAGQMQQSPEPRGGGIFQRAWWQPWQPNDGKFPLCDYVIASLDSAFTEKEENDPSALTVFGVFTHPETKQRGIIMIDAWRKWLKVHGIPTPRNERETINVGDTRQIVRMKDIAWKNRVSHEWGFVEWAAYTCRLWKVDKLLIEGKSSGITVADELVRLHGFEDWAVQLMPVRGDKYARALSVQPTFAQLKVWAPLRDWAEMVIDEMATFPKSKHDDLVDSVTQAIRYLRDNGLARTDREVQELEFDSVRHKSRLKPLYAI